MINGTLLLPSIDESETFLFFLPRHLVKIKTILLQIYCNKLDQAGSEPPKGVKIKSAINSINPFNWINVARSINDEKPDYVVIRYWLPFMAPCLGFIARLLDSNIKILAITIAYFQDSSGLSKLSFEQMNTFWDMAKVDSRGMEMGKKS